MKKTALFLLLLTMTTALLYNAVSYYLMYAYQKEQSWINTMKHIPDAEFEVIKVNASLYSFVEDREMEFVNENVVINHKNYHIFKKQIKDNVVHLYYLRNHNQDRISESLKHIVDDELFQSTSGKTPLKKFFKTVLNDYIAQQTIAFVCHYTNSHTKEFTTLPNAELHSGFLKNIYSPPKMA
ncbi:MAG: hypothetical protein KA213_02630 [Flavobacterium sp.]|nr:hypothetical protein [Flavobacterium sp.]